MNELKLNFPNEMSKYKLNEEHEYSINLIEMVIVKKNKSETVKWLLNSFMRCL